MRIAITINTSWNIYNFRENLVSKLLSEGHQVIATAPKDKYTDRLIAWGCVYEEIPIKATSTNPFTDFVLIWKYRKIFRRHKIDVVLSYTIKPNIYGSLATIFLPTKIIANVSGLGTTFLTRRFSSRVAHLLYRFAFRFTDHIFFQNSSDRQDFVTKVPVNLSKTSILPGSGIDLVRYQPVKKQTSKKLIFLMISRVIVEKGVREYASASIKLLAEESNVICKLVGAFDPRHSRSVGEEELEEWMRQGLVVEGHTDNVMTEIENADVIVLPSYREGTPRTLLEGAALSRPLIATDVPGCREAVNHGENGFLCEAGSEDSLLSAMRAFCQLSASEREVMGNASRRLAENKYDVKYVVDSYKEIISKLVSRED